MNKKVSLGLTISIAALTAAITFIVTSFFSLQNFNQKVQAVKDALRHSTPLSVRITIPISMKMP